LKKPLVAALALVALAGGACGSSSDSPVLEQSGIEAPIRDDKPEAKAAVWKAGRWTGPVTGGFKAYKLDWTARPQ
jgi:hypothetical protein